MMTKQIERKPDYRIYPSLLDNFQDLHDYERLAEEDWNRDSETGEYKLSPDEMYLKIESELIDTINRCPKSANEAADKGTAFNEIVDCLIEHRKSSRKDCKIYSCFNRGGLNAIKVIRAEINGFVFDFDINLCKEAAEFFVGSLPQYCAESTMRTAYGDVEIYGFTDEWVGNRMYDIKTTGRYSFGKFERKWQRHAYPWCAIDSGMATEIESFTYWVVEWAYQRKGDPLKAKSITQETYTYDHQDTEIKLREHVERFIEWLEARRSYITDKKIFGGENPSGYHGEPISIDKLKEAIFKETA